MLSTRIYSYSECEKRMKLTSGFTKHMNVYRNHFIRQVLPICMQFKTDTLMPREDDDALKNFGLYRNEESILKEQEMEKNYRDLVSKSLDTEIRARDGFLGHTLQARLFASRLSSFSKEVRFRKRSSSLLNLYQSSNIITRVPRMIILFIRSIINWTMHLSTVVQSLK